MSLREEILDYDDKTIQPVSVPEWPTVNVFVCSLSAKEKGAFEKKMISQKTDYARIMAEYVAAITVDENGKKIFTPKDAEPLMKKSSSAIERIFEAGQKLNTLDENDIEALAKNS